MANNTISGTGKKLTKYARLKKAASNYCKTGSAAAKEKMDKAAKAYKEDAVKKGKTASEAEKIISNLKKCPKK